jgi:hypothetical protein
MDRKVSDRFIDSLKWLDYQLYRFFSFWGEVIMNRPSKLLYAILIIAAIFFPLFAGFLVLSLLCYAYKKYSGYSYGGI